MMMIAQGTGGEAPGAAAVAGVGIASCVGGLIYLLCLAFTIWMLIDAIKKCPSEGNKKLIWILVIIFGCSPIGAIIYYFVQRPKNPAAAPPTK